MKTENLFGAVRSSGKCFDRTGFDNKDMFKRCAGLIKIVARVQGSVALDDAVQFVYFSRFQPQGETKVNQAAIATGNLYLI